MEAAGPGCAVGIPAATEGSANGWLWTTVWSLWRSRTGRPYASTGGGLAAAPIRLAVVFAPVIALMFVVVAALASVAAVYTRKAAENRLRRRDCPHCQHRVRVQHRHANRFAAHQPG